MKRPKFLDASDILRGIQEIDLLTDADPVSVALVGGAALQLYGSDRLTRDVDIIATRIPSGLTPHGGLAFGGAQTTTPSGIPVDVIVRDDDATALYNAALKVAQHVPGVQIPVVPLEYLVAMKLNAGRPKDDLDLMFILTETDVDYPVARGVVEKFMGGYAARALDSIKSEVEWKKSR